MTNSNNNKSTDKTKNELEIKVRERTEELYQSKKRLETEIVSRKIIEKLLKESETKYRNIVEHSSNLFYTHTPNHVLTYISPQSHNFLGCSPDEAKKQWMNFVTDNPINAEGLKLTQKAIDTGIQQIPFDLELKTTQGKILHVEVHEAPVVENGKTISIVGALIDITYWKTATNKIKNNERKFRELFENAPDGILQLDIKGNILDCNKAYCEMLDFTSKELIGTHIKEAIISQQRQLFNENFPTLIKTGKLLIEELHLKKRNGQLIIARRSANVIYDESGKPSSIIVHTHDITKQKELEEKLINAKKLEAVGLMASRLAHEFKNILQSIMGHSYFAIKNLDEKDQRFKDIKQIQKATDRANTIVNNLLNSEKQFKLNLMRVNIHSIVNQFVNSNQNTFGKQSTIEYYPGKDTEKMLINGDPLHIELVILNICINASNAITDKGEIKIETTIQLNKKVQNDVFDWVDDKNFVTITISDNGKGMTKEIIAHIFEPFFTTKAVDKGTGLGLSSAFEIAKSHMGFIEVESIIGKGSIFFISIPLVD